jgi:diguanylate cyclase (GGDEF)-like protein/PAS domain S-box-containing protein
MRILLADDSLATSLPLIAYLRECGHQVRHVADGSQAVSAFESERPELILMDVVMPVMDGIEATRRIKALEGENWVPLIMMTALSDKRDLVAGLQAGADDYLIKPVDMLELSARINSMLRISNVQRRLHSILDNAFDGIVSIDGRGIIQEFNKSAEQVFGYRAHEVIGHNVGMLMPSPDREMHDGHLARYLSEGHSRIMGKSRKLTGQRKNGEHFLMQLALTEIQQADGVQFIGVIRDISLEEEARRRIEFLAHHDHLTGLPNRARFSDMLDMACRRAEEQPCAVLFLDLDGFKPVNDQYGHDAGDLALRIVAKRLLATLSSGDFVARLGGDEFVILLPGVKDGATAAATGQRLIEAIDQPMDLRGHACQVGASIGVALIGGPGATPDSVLTAADNCMYAAKRTGKNRVVLTPLAA